MITIVACARGTQSQYTECEATEPRLMLIVGCLGLVVNIGYAVILAWGGAEVKHAHSHGDGDDHGHSHGGSHGHGSHHSKKSASSSTHGHSHDHQEVVMVDITMITDLTKSNAVNHQKKN
jgi:ABC-type nickel/cobalt efflux system permease component RcnA